MPPFLSNPLAKMRQPQTEKISLDNLTIGRYQLKSLIGSNPLGDVYLTYDRLREQDIALKTIQINMIPPHLLKGLDSEFNHFQPELDLLRQSEHPHLVPVMSIGKSLSTKRVRWPNGCASSPAACFPPPRWYV
jgi:serine/threonine protein kinase